MLLISEEKDQLPAQRDIDNVNEFRKLYDDSWAYRYQPLTGKKKVPPTKPYVEMLLLLDMLKRDAKRLNLNKFQVNFKKKLLNFLTFNFQCTDETVNRELIRLSQPNISAREQLYEVMLKVYQQNEYEGVRTKERIVNLLTGKKYLVFLNFNLKTIFFQNWENLRVNTSTLSGIFRN